MMCKIGDIVFNVGDIVDCRCYVGEVETGVITGCYLNKYIVNFGNISRVMAAADMEHASYAENRFLFISHSVKLKLAGNFCHV